ncbi:MAG: rhomboid family intramembrane serine protease [Sphingomonas sp.]|nr:rhomboid family intramembrane serine protease [Sphingomonas sp.]
MTVVIAVITALAWVLAVLTGFDAAYFMGFIPARFSGLVTTSPAVPAFITPLTTTLVHSGPVHIGFNLLVLIWCGLQVERVLGKTGLIALYLVGAYASALLQWATNPASIVPMVGASGAISAVIGAYALIFGRPKRITSSTTINRWINALWLLVAWIVLQYMTEWLAGQQGYLLATAAHVGGFAAGLLLQRPLLLWRYRKA